MHLLLAILATLAGTGSALVTLIFLAACMPNSGAAQLASLKGQALLVIAVWAVAVLAAGWALLARRHGLAAGIGIAPAVVCAALITWLFATSG